MNGKLPEERNEFKACALLLEWVEQGKRGFPSEETLADAVTFARLATKGLSDQTTRSEA